MLGNRIGIAASTDAAVANHGDGVQLNGGGSELGADAPGSANTIANNGADGVFVSGGPANAITGNSIYSNGGLGIDLAPNGVTPNDVEDGDSGPNDLQNFPEFESVTFATGIDRPPAHRRLVSGLAGSGVLPHRLLRERRLRSIRQRRRRAAPRP